eukprot:13222113-Alexandrium_andersonii.AAC.1
MSAKTGPLAASGINCEAVAGPSQFKPRTPAACVRARQFNLRALVIWSPGWNASNLRVERAVLLSDSNNQ